MLSVFEKIAQYYKLRPYQYDLVRRKSDGSLFRHSTSIEGPPNSEEFEYITMGAYDAEGYLKAKYWSLPRTGSGIHSIDGGNDKPS